MKKILTGKTISQQQQQLNMKQRKQRYAVYLCVNCQEVLVLVLDFSVENRIVFMFINGLMNEISVAVRSLSRSILQRLLFTVNALLSPRLSHKFPLVQFWPSLCHARWKRERSVA